MPLVAHNQLPTFVKLASEGVKVLKPNVAVQQDIRELHIGLLNMMPDAALEATERQFFRLIGESNPIAQFFVHPFSLPEIPRDAQTTEHIQSHYETFEQIKESGLDALIISGATVTELELKNEVFWDALIEVVDWAYDNVTSTLCSCIATHAVLEFRYGQKRKLQNFKKWGVFEHSVLDRSHPLVSGINTRFDVPHSRWNNMFPEQFETAKLKVLAAAENDCIHLATSEDGFRTVFFQGHPEYDTISLLKEYKREVNFFISGQRDQYPPLPVNYFGLFDSALFREHEARVKQAIESNSPVEKFPEALILDRLNNTWHDTACAVVGNWIGLIYQITHKDRHKPFMEGVDPDNPLHL